MAHQSGQLQKEQSQLGQSVLAAAITISISAATFNPLDCLRVRWQVAGAAQTQGPDAKLTLQQFALRIWRQEGLWRGYYQPGLGTNMAACAVSGGLRIGCYPLCRELVGWTFGDHEKGARSMAIGGFVAGAMGFFMAGPLFRIKTLLQAHAGLVNEKGILSTGVRAGQPPRYRTFWGATHTTIRDAGLFHLFTGTGVLVVRGSLLSAGQQLGYDGCKTYCKKHSLLQEGPMLHVVGSICAAFLSATAATPADVLMTRYQTASQIGAHYKNVTECALGMVRTEGPQVFVRGWCPFFFRLAPLYCMMLPMMEQVRLLLGIGYMS